MKIYIFTLLAICFNSCILFEQYEPTLNEKEAAFRAAVFDQRIISDFPKYDAFAQLMLINIDTIINYKNSKNYITLSRNGKDSMQLRKDNCFMFQDYNSYYDIKEIPQYLSLEADSLWASIGKPAVEICKDKMPASFVIKKEFRKLENRILECHFLYWNLNDKDNKDSFDFVNDTMLSNHCTYRIGIAKDNSGW